MKLFGLLLPTNKHGFVSSKTASQLLMALLPDPGIDIGWKGLLKKAISHAPDQREIDTRVRLFHKDFFDVLERCGLKSVDADTNIHQDPHACLICNKAMDPNLSRYPTTTSWQGDSGPFTAHEGDGWTGLGYAGSLKTWFRKGERLCAHAPLSPDGTSRRSSQLQTFSHQLSSA